MESGSSSHKSARKASQRVGSAATGSYAKGTLWPTNRRGSWGSSWRSGRWRMPLAVTTRSWGSGRPSPASQAGGWTVGARCVTAASASIALAIFDLVGSHGFSIVPSGVSTS